ncbi:MAG: recombinase family protein [Acholeplasmatales bacterium]|nr:recombinase family protein [Acholeplasmatales bacterium]
MLTKKNAKRKSKLTKLRCGVYARKSQEDERDTSLDTQINYCKQLINSTLMLEYVDTYQEDNKSGMWDDRPEFQRAISDIESNTIDVIVCYKWDRFARKQSDTQNYYHRVIAANGYVLAGDATLVIEDATTLFMQQQFWAMEEYQARTSAERTFTTMCNEASKGKYMAGETPIGYRRLQDGTLEIVPDESIIVDMIFNSILSGLSLGQIARDLKKAHYMTREGNWFSKQAIQYIARNEIYTGTMKYNKANARKKKHRLLQQDYNEIVVRNACDAIVSIETYNQVQSILDSNQTNRCSYDEHIYLLSGLMICKKCGKHMVGYSSSGRS